MDTALIIYDMTDIHRAGHVGPTEECGQSPVEEENWCMALLSIFNTAFCWVGDEFCTAASLCQQCDLSIAGMILKCSDTSFVMFYGYVLCIKSSQ